VKGWKKNIEKIVKWLYFEPQRHPYIDLTKTKLIEESVKKFGRK
jgi:hypothetical protein